MTRAELLECLTAHIVARRPPHPLRVAIDGVDAAGKTRLADELAPRVAAAGRPVVRASVDDFHRPAADRYRAGRDSPEGYFRDSFDYPALRARLLVPLGPHGDRRYRARAFDYRRDAPVDEPLETAPADAVLLLDGIFLQRPELAGDFELAIFLDVPFEVSVPRMAARDGAPPGIEHPANRRYVGGQRLYLDTCRPRERADLVVDYRDFEAPRISQDPSAR